MDSLQILIQTLLLDVSKAQASLNSQLKKIKLDPVKVDVAVNGTAFQGQTAKVTTSVRQFNAEIERTIAKNKLDTYFNKNTIAAKSFSAQVDDLRVKASNMLDPTQQKSWNREFMSLTSSVKAAGEEGVGVFERLSKNASKFFGWLLTSGVVMFGVASVKNLIDNVVSLDKSLVDLQMATGGTREEMDSLINSYSQLAKKLGATTAEVASSANDFLRQGKSIEETNKLIETSVILSKVGMLDSASATQYLTSAMKGYRLETDAAIGVVDKLSSVDMVSATSAGGLATGMSYVANNANLAGVEMDRLIGYLAVVGEVTQKSMETVGTAFNTIFSRMANIKLKRLVDPETQEDLSNVETVLNNLGIKLRDSNSKFRDFGDVLDEVGGQWNSYSSVQQRALAVAFAGVRNQENFLVLMENYGTALKYAEVAANSNGTAMQKMAMYQESVEAKTKALTASFEELSRTIVDTNVISGFLDGSSDVLGFLNTVIKNLGLIPTLLTAISAAMSISGKNAGRTKVNMPSYARLRLVA